jgi:long-chain acyl-CoA synthetase
MNPFRAGIGLLAENLGVPVLPMRIDGLFEVKQSGRRFTAPWKIRVRIGEPLRFPSGTDEQQFANELQKAVERL